MFSFVWRQAKRVFVLAVGLGAIWFIVRRIFPWLDDHLPLLVAMTLTYIVGAYGVMPLVIRVLRFLFRPKHIPLYTTTPDGFACDPVNIGIVGSEADLRKAMRRAGWNEAERRTIKTLFKMGMSFALKVHYPTAPFSNLYLFGRAQDLGFQKPVAGSPRARHHVRFWACTTDTLNPRHHQHVQFWLQQPHAPKSAEQLWVGAASRDIGMALILHNAQFTHAIHPDTNAERDFIIEELEAIGIVRKLKYIQAGEPYAVRNRAWGTYMVADGDLLLVHLKHES